MKIPSKNEIEYYDNTVIKTFHPRSKPGILTQDEAFANELAAYKHFERIRWGWNPSLMGYNIEKRQIQIERIKGVSLTEMIARKLEFNVEQVISELIELDRLLWLNRINCLQIKSDDILLEEGSFKIFMIDFEHTYLNSRFKKILCNQLLGPKLYKIEENETKRRFISSLQKRRSRFHKYYFRMNYILIIWFCRRFLFRKKGDEILR
jgi:hypothetical protein